MGSEAAATFHLGDAWLDSWSGAFGPARRVEGLAVVTRRERLGPIPYRVLASATNPHSLHYDAATDAALPPDLPARLLAQSGAACARFDYLPADARLLAAARGWRGHRVTIAPHALAPVVDCRGSYDAWFAARSKRIRQRLRHDGATVFERLGMAFEVRSDDPVASGLLPRLFALEQAGWKGRGGTAILDDPATARFYTDLAQRAAGAGALRIATLWHEGRPVAFEYGVLGARRLFLLKVAYDEAFADLSLGYVLAARHIRACFEAPDVDWYDKMGNGLTPAPYKLRFANGVDTLHRLTLYAPGAVGRLLHARDAARARAKAWRDARREAAA